MRKLLFTPIIFLTVLSGCTPSKTEIDISAAASLQPAMAEIESNYEQANPNIDLVINYGGSGTLVTQIEQGAPADIFFSASKSNFDNLAADDKIVDSTNLLTNKLVVITNKDNPTNQYTKDSIVAIGTPDAVPAGTYAKQSLQALDMWKTVKSNLVQTKDVSQVLSYVESGNADLGFVYQTNVANSDKVTVVKTIDDKLHDPIIYPVGTLNDKSTTTDFYNYLLSDKATAVFKDYGFTIDA